MSEEIPVVAIFTPAVGKVERLKEVLLNIIAEVEEKEMGVTKYQMFTQLNAETGKGVILFQETYANQAAADIHLSTPYFAALNETLVKEALLEKPFELFVLGVVGGFAGRA
ncbi:Dimeric alpha+beta barrel [Glarea lozoyensis ATCC 20868]|uniref:Dimeric alpha+beta barrel n=1 Tax=Glarea lozoyensis (strain ATCC 20868 / MF5171) TaxID=1116229 RepID=S3D6S2_GLAL2|nr:Dimeric alpha+beta barrel [Glarea lozoyensis ATCC 20868]EPE33480.1 Dimeric alpha+beta barrel [Glarea lozoyensis ATCC 20868]